MNSATLRVIDAGGQEKRLAFAAPKRLSDILAQNGLPVDMPCGGKQRCLKCKVVATGDLSPMSRRESTLLSEDEKARSVRYACMTEALGDAQICLLADDVPGQILTKGHLPAFALEPWGKQYGVAIDIGTTTVAAYLYDLAGGSLLKTLADKNPQSVFGADVISRLEKATGGEGKALADSIRRCVTQLLDGLSRSANLSVEAVDSLVLTGNTAMLYLLCGLDPQALAKAPFVPDCKFGAFWPGHALDLPAHLKIYLPRCISAFVGADITTALLAAEFIRQGDISADRPRLLVDIGTNGEMALAAAGRLWCCSTAAGPAFEGAGIYQGMPAQAGAVCQVRLEDSRIVSTVLGGKKAAGICGSGLLDAVFVMLKAGIIDETGVLRTEGHSFAGHIREINGQPAFCLPGTPVVITQQDIRAVQLAKSAIYAGMMTLMQTAGYGCQDIGELVIAGGFGSNLDVRSAEGIGMIPPGFAKKAYAIGNAAGSGAAMILLSDTIREQSEEIDRLAATVELSTNAYFIDTYIMGMYFPQT